MGCGKKRAGNHGGFGAGVSARAGGPGVSGRGVSGRGVSGRGVSGRGNPFDGIIGNVVPEDDEASYERPIQMEALPFL